MTKAKPDKRKIGEMIRIIEDDGWYFVRKTGSHMQFKHPTKRGVVTVPDTGINKNLELSIKRQAGIGEIGRKYYEARYGKDVKNESK